MKIPPVWLPKAYYINIDKEKIRVNYREDDQIIEDSLLIKIKESQRKGEEADRNDR